jgi:hypothetical protein
MNGRDSSSIMKGLHSVSAAMINAKSPSDWNSPTTNMPYEGIGESSPALNMILAHALSCQDMQTFKTTIRKMRLLDSSDPIVNRALSLLDDTDYNGVNSLSQQGRLVKLSVTSAMRLMLNDAVEFSISRACKAITFELVAYSRKMGVQLKL